MNASKHLAWIALAVACGGGAPDVPCSALGQCLPGFRCIENVCIVCGEDRCPAPAGLGTEGGLICGADDVCIEIPRQALAARTSIAVSLARTASSTPALISLSPIYSITPTDTALMSPAKVDIPISSTIAVDRIGLYRGDSANGPWIRVEGNNNAVTASGRIDRLGFVTAAAQR